MKTAADNPIADAVFRALEFCGANPDDARRETTPVRCLGILDDDLSYVFVPEVEESLGVTVLLSEWETVSTVGEIISMLHRYVT